MSYVKIEDKEFTDIEEAVIYAEDSKLNIAVIDVYTDYNKLVERQTINSTDNYKYYAYAIFEAVEYYEIGPFWECYNGYKKFYNTIEECQMELKIACVGKYKITAVYQDLSGYYFDERDIMYVDVVMQTRYLT